MRRGQRVCQTRGVVPRGGSGRDRRGLQQRGAGGVAWGSLLKGCEPVQGNASDHCPCSLAADFPGFTADE